MRSSSKGDAIALRYVARPIRDFNSRPRDAQRYMMHIGYNEPTVASGADATGDGTVMAAVAGLAGMISMTIQKAFSIDQATLEVRCRSKSDDDTRVRRRATGIHESTGAPCDQHGSGEGEPSR